MRIDQLQKSLKKRDDATTGVGATLAPVQSAERLLQVSFPKPLVAYLEHIGWMQLGDREFFGLGADVPSHLELTSITRSEREDSGCPIPHSLIPLQNDGAGNLYCMDVSAEPNRRGRIFFWDHELGVRQRPEKVAHSWTEWISEQLELADAALRPVGTDEVRRFLSAVPREKLSLHGLVAAYRSQYGDEACERLRSEVLEIALRHVDDDAALEARVRELGFEFKPSGEVQTLREFLTQVAVNLFP